MRWAKPLEAGQPCQCRTEAKGTGRPTEELPYRPRVQTTGVQVGRTTILRAPWSPAKHVLGLGHERASMPLMPFGSPVLCQVRSPLVLDSTTPPVSPSAVLLPPRLM